MLSEAMSIAGSIWSGFHVSVTVPHGLDSAHLVVHATAAAGASVFLSQVLALAIDYWAPGEHSKRDILMSYITAGNATILAAYYGLGTALIGALPPGSSRWVTLIAGLIMVADVVQKFGANWRYFGRLYQMVHRFTKIGHVDYVSRINVPNHVTSALVGASLIFVQGPAAYGAWFVAVAGTVIVKLFTAAIFYVFGVHV
jgi:hypothetical protein